MSPPSYASVVTTAGADTTAKGASAKPQDAGVKSEGAPAKPQRARAKPQRARAVAGAVEYPPAAHVRGGQSPPAVQSPRTLTRAEVPASTRTKPSLWNHRLCPVGILAGACLGAMALAGGLTAYLSPADNPPSRPPPVPYPQYR